MHVAYLCGQYPPGCSANGIDSYTAVMAEEMARRGHAVSVFCRETVGEANKTDASSNGRVTPHRVAVRGFKVPLFRVVYYRLGGRLFPGYVQAADAGKALRAAIAQAHREKPVDVLECPEVRGLSSWLNSLDIPIVVRLHAPRAVTALANGERPNRVLSGIN